VQKPRQFHLDHAPKPVRVEGLLLDWPHSVLQVTGLQSRVVKVAQVLQADRRDDLKISVPYHLDLQIHERWRWLFVAEFLERIDELLVVDCEKLVAVVLTVRVGEKVVEGVSEVEGGCREDAGLEVELELWDKFWKFSWNVFRDYLN
jgi:hypothetical protein